MRRASAVTGLTLAICLIGAAPARGQSSPATPVDDLGGYFSQDVDEEGWDYLLRLGANLNLGNSQNVIGARDGRNMNFGLQLTGHLSFSAGQHEWRSLLGLYETLGVTPDIDGLQRTVDRLGFDTFYFFHFERPDWLGLYARFHLTTHLLAGYDLHDTAKDYVVVFLDGTSQETTTDSFRLTDPFRPLTLSEGLGLNAEGSVSEAFHLQFLLGWGAMQVFSDEQFAVIEDPPGGPIVVRELESFRQTGPESILTLSGGFDDRRVTYKADAGVMLPVWFSDTVTSEGASTLDLMFFRASLAVSFQVWEWLSIDYHFNSVRNPQLIDAFQNTSSLLFTINLTLLQDDDGSGSDGGDAPAGVSGADGAGYGAVGPPS